MAVNKDSAVAEILPRLKKTDISLIIRMSGLILPRVLDGFLPTLDETQRNAFDKVFPMGGEKKIYIKLKDTPTPPIVMKMAQPVKIVVKSEEEVKQERIKGIKLTTDDLQLMTGGLTLGVMFRLSWRLRGQLCTTIGILRMFKPLLRLGSSGLKDMGEKLTAKWQPLLDLFSKLK